MGMLKGIRYAKKLYVKFNSYQEIIFQLNQIMSSLLSSYKW